MITKPVRQSQAIPTIFTIGHSTRRACHGVLLLDRITQEITGQAITELLPWNWKVGQTQIKAAA